MSAGTSDPLDELDTLQRGMTAQTLKLEMQAEHLAEPTLRRLVGAYVQSAMVLRDLIRRVSGTPNVVPEAVPSFEQMLRESVLWAHRWAVPQVREIRCLLVTQTAGGPRSLPLEALAVFHDMADLCESSGSSEAKALVNPLRSIDDALYQLIEMRDRIEHTFAVAVPSMPQRRGCPPPASERR
jgi:hypothetical protein